MRTFKISICLLLVLAASLQAAFVAVLETVADPLVKDKVTLADRQYLTNVLREQAVKELPASQNYTIMTRENIMAMLPPGKSIEDCEGNCLAETGKNIAADYICQARVSSFNGSLTLSAELYETAGNKLIASFNGLGPNQSTLLTHIIQKSPEFFRHVKEDSKYKSQNIAMETATASSTNTAPVLNNAPAQNATPYAIENNATENSLASNSQAEKTNWRRFAFFLHGGYLTAGLGFKIRLGQENRIYMAADLRWVSFRGDDYMYMPLMFYFGGNNIHFITGVTIKGGSDEESQEIQVPIGVNYDFGKHFGIDGLFILPSTKKFNGALMLDARVVF